MSSTELFSSRYLIWILIGCGRFFVLPSGGAVTTYQVPMRDGVTLATDVYLPARGSGPWPVILGRTPYGKKTSSDLSSFTSSGMAVVIQDVRGRYDSGGHARPFADDGWGKLQDGYDTVLWIRQQAWCNGKIATIGGSAGGITQMQLAGAAPPGLVGQLIEAAPMSSYHTTFYFGGVFRKSLAEGWLAAVQWPSDNLTEIRSHPTYDEYWQVQNLAERVDQVNWPVALLGGWYDIFQQGTIDAFVEIQKHGGSTAKKHVHLILGPWHHAGGTKVGELTFPDRSSKSGIWPDRSNWFDFFLNAKPLNPNPPPVRYYTMGHLPVGKTIPGNVWRTSETWPPESRLTPFYLTSGHKLQVEKPVTTAMFTYLYDPQNPVPTLGGQNLVLPMGSFDQRPIENRDDVLLFTTDPLPEPLEITGRLTAVLYVSTSAVDTDFTAKLTDVYPDGRSMLLSDGIRKLSFRESFTNPQPAVPGEVYRLEVDLWSTSIVFNTGHCIRLAISSSNSPRFELNPNTGNPDRQAQETVKAQQTLYMGGEQASYLLLPVIENPSKISTWDRYEGNRNDQE